MFVSHETADETETRLRRVIAEARLTCHDGEFVFREYPITNFPAHHSADALALVQDGEVWSALLPSSASSSEEALRIFSFHFTEGLDNSGFVGWLATHLKRTIGTGVLVICGQNSTRGGIFDYWGVPSEVGDAVLRKIKQLQVDSCGTT